jgi:hypothetical protein
MYTVGTYFAKIRNNKIVQVFVQLGFLEKREGSV